MSSVGTAFFTKFSTLQKLSNNHLFNLYYLYLMKNYLLLLFLLLCLSVYSQGGNRLAARRVFEFRKSSTIVILDNVVNGQETPYNIALKKAIDTYWNITPVVYKRQSELPYLLPMKNFSLLVKSNRMVFNADGFSVQRHSDFTLFMADKDSLSFLGGVDEISTVDIFDTQDPVEVTYKMPLLIRAMMQYIYFISADGGIDPHDFYRQTEKFFNKNHNLIHKDTLYVCKEDLPLEIPVEEFKRLYKHPCRILSRGELPKIIDKGGKGFVFHVDMGYKQIYVLKISDGTICYHAGTKENGKLARSDINKM